MLWTVVLEKTLESPLDCKEIQPVHSKGDQSWVFIGRTDANAETPIFWLPDEKSWLICKDPDAGKDWGQEEKGTTEDEMIGWHHRLNGHEFEWTPRVGDGQGGLVCCSPWGRKELDTTEQPNWTEWIQSFTKCYGQYANHSDKHVYFLLFRIWIHFNYKLIHESSGLKNYYNKLKVSTDLALLLLPMPRESHYHDLGVGP